MCIRDSASSNPRNQLAQRGHNKQGRHNLRQVGLSYVPVSYTHLDVYKRQALLMPQPING